MTCWMTLQNRVEINAYAQLFGDYKKPFFFLFHTLGALR